MLTDPSSPHALKARAASLLHAGHPAEARPLLETLCQQQFTDPEAWYLLGTAHGLLGQHDRCAECCQRALALRPTYPEVHNSLGNALASIGRLAEAETGYRAALNLNARYAEAHLNLAQVLQLQGRAAEAETHYRAFLQLNPHNPLAHFRLGLTLMTQHRPAEAETAFRTALRLEPDFVEAHNNLGIALRALNRPAEAETAYRAVLRLKPAYAETLANLGSVLQSQGKTEEAIETLKEALRLKPDLAAACLNLGNVYAQSGRLSEAIVSYREVLLLKPGSAMAHGNLSHVYFRLAEPDKGVACYREACRLDPAYAATTYSTFLLNLNYHPDWTAQAIFEEHRRWGQTYAPQPEELPAHANRREPERRLKIGYVSPDLRDHSVAFFLEPVLENHDRQKYEVYAYAEVPRPDTTTARLRERVAHWRDTIGISDTRLAQQIRDDGIDILVDLAGHTAGNRLGVFAHRPAPVQATYIGYPNTTGLPAMDYRITNSLTTPPEFDRYFTETVVRLPFANCFAHPADCPPLAAPPVLASGRVTFGCFNNLAKLAPPVIALWAEVLRAVPGSRLMLKSRPLDDLGTRELFLDRFAVHGIGPERLLLRGAEPFLDYLRSFNDVDIALDPFPFNGHTITCHGLWMGVPVITLEGRRPVSRMGYGVLATLDLEELAAKTPAEYVAIAAGLAADPGRLQSLRGSLRERMLASPLKDGRRYTAALEDLYRDMWRNWCDRAPDDTRTDRANRSGTPAGGV